MKKLDFGWEKTVFDGLKETGFYISVALGKRNLILSIFGIFFTGCHNVWQRDRKFVWIEKYDWSFKLRRLRNN